MTSFDIRTLFLAGSMTGLASAAAVFAMRRLHVRSTGAAVWASLALASAGLSMLGIAFRGEIPDLLSYTLANAIGTASSPLLYESVRRLCRVRPQPELAIVSILFMITYQMSLGDTPADISSRVVVSSVYGAVYAALMMPLLTRRLSRDPPAAVAGSIALVGAYFVGYVTRATSTLFGVDAPTAQGEFVSGLVHTLVGLMFTLVPMLFAMCLMYWINGRVRRELRRDATTDELTGLATRRTLFAHARDVLRTSGQQAPRVRTAGMLMVDLDHFKQINDRFGHQVGDSVLAHAAATLRDALTRSDGIGRYGGEEFCVVVQRPSRAAIRATAEALCEAIRSNPYDLDGQPIQLSVSIGMSTDDEFHGFDQMLAAADRLLYRAKALGRDRVADSDTPPPRHARRAGDLHTDPASAGPSTFHVVARPRAVTEARVARGGCLVDTHTTAQEAPEGERETPVATV
jgi:diguanylate cyclase (GGDEF)-like protein